jgi:hypothetical protein
MLPRALDALLAEDDAIDAALVFDDLGNVVAAATRNGAGDLDVESIAYAWITLRSRGRTPAEVRVELEDRAFLAAPLGDAFVALCTRPETPLGRLSLRVRLHHDALIAALP